MTIVMIGHKGLPARSGGIERHVEELSAGLVRLGARVVSFDREWYVENGAAPAGVERRFSKGFCTKHLDAISHTFTALIAARREKPDIIHIHGVGPSLLLPLARVLHPKARLVSTFHCVDRLHAKWGLVARTMLRMGEAFSCLFAHRTIAVSDALAAYCLDTYQCQPVVVPNGVRISEPPAVGTLERFGLTANRYFLMATRLVPHKNVHVAMEAHRLFAQRRPELAMIYPLIIAGGSSWTSLYEHDLIKQAAGLPGVQLVGERHGEELLSLQAYAAAHLSVANSEGMSIALLEAMSLARPVIISDIPENTEVTDNLAPRVPAGDAQTLSDAMECAALLSDAERAEIGAQLQARVRNNHDWTVIAKMTFNVYQELLEARQIAPAIA